MQVLKDCNFQLLDWSGRPTSSLYLLLEIDSIWCETTKNPFSASTSDMLSSHPVRQFAINNQQKPSWQTIRIRFQPLTRCTDDLNIGQEHRKIGERLAPWSKKFYSNQYIYGAGGFNCVIHTTVDIPQNSFYRQIFPNNWSIDTTLKIEIRSKKILCTCNPLQGPRFTVNYNRLRWSS